MISDSASRVTRSRSSLRRALLLFAAVLAGVTALRAQETPPPAPPAAAPAPGGPAPGAEPPATGRASPAAEETAGGEPAAPASTNAEAPATAPTAGKPAGPVGPTRDRFEPTEKVRADFDVSFPVDI